MKRRAFIKQAGFAAVGAIALPYILPSGRFFASTNGRKVNHVVFCLFGGGVRNRESILKAEGNLMSNTLNGDEAISSAIEHLPPSPLNSPLQNYGTLFRQFKYAKGPTGHYNAHMAALTGVYTEGDLNTQDGTQVPTLFELYHKHGSDHEKKAWYISNTLAPYANLNYSNHAYYGSSYGANYVAADSPFAQAENILTKHTPALTVITIQDMDICHVDFTRYCNNIRKTDYAVAHLWSAIQSIPQMADDTVLIIAPDHGRNEEHNDHINNYGRYGLDHDAAHVHSGDQEARNIFCLIAGPSHIIKHGQVMDVPAGETIEIAPAIAHMLDFEEQIPKRILKPFPHCDIAAAFA